MTDCNPRPDHGADDQWADDLRAMRADIEAEKADATTAVARAALGDRYGELLTVCRCAHPYHEAVCPRPGCGCRVWRARPALDAADVAQDRRSEHYADGRDDMADEIETEWPR